MMTNDKFASYFADTLLKLDTSFVNAYSDSGIQDDFKLFCQTLRDNLGDNNDYPFEFLNPYQYAPDSTQNRIEFFDKLGSKDEGKRKNIACYTNQNMELSKYVASVRTLAGEIDSLSFLRRKPCILTSQPPVADLAKSFGFANLLVFPRFPAEYKTAKDFSAAADVLDLNRANFEMLSKDGKICADFIALNQHIREFAGLSVAGGTRIVLTKFLNYFGWTRLTYENCDTVMMIPPTTIPNLTPFGLVAGFKIEKWSDDLAQQVKGVEVLAAHGLSFWVERVLKEKERMVESHARKTAVSAIMGRNMSHNIGSHVLNYLSEKSDFYGYLRDKMNFLTEIVTSKPSWGVSMAFLPDVLAAFADQKDLLDNIFRSELDRSDNPIDKLNICYCDSEKNTKRFFWKDKTLGPMLLSGQAWPLVHIPHGVIGCHAFYSLMEGFIRNSAKHNRERLNQASTFRICIQLACDFDEKLSREFFRLRISDNISDYKKCNLPNKPKDCDCEEKYRKNCATHINNLLKEGLLNKEGAIAGTAWGLRELLMCAKWLRKIPAADEPAAIPPILELKEENCKWFWELYLLKPQTALLVGQGFEEDTEKGIYVDKTLEAFEERLKANKLAHTFVVIDGEDRSLKDWLKSTSNLLKLPQRLFVATDGDAKCLKYVCVKRSDIPQKADYATLAEKLYEKLIYWLNNDKMPGKIKLFCDDNITNSLDKYFLCKPEAEITPNVANTDIVFAHGGMRELDCRYFEAFTRGGRDPVWAKLIAAPKNNHIALGMYEAALLRVLIVDERIYKTLADRANSEPYQKWKKMGVEFATIDGEGSVVCGSGVFSRPTPVKQYVHDKKFHFISIHQTLKEFIEVKSKGAMECFQNIAGNLIIHSARGDIGIPTDYKFIDYSNLRAMLIDRPDKHALADRLMGLTGNGR